MVAVPAAMPVTSPDEAPTVATVVLPLVQLPPASASLNVVIDPAHTASVPAMADGNGLTVTTACAMQPVAVLVKVMIAVPADIPEKRPVDPTVAVLVLSLVQVPGILTSDKIVDEPAHKVLIPVIAAGNGFTVTALVALQPVGNV
jgi:hypothetical protein